MKKCILISLTPLFAASLIAADTSPQDDVTAAAKKLADQDNYSWRTTVVVPEDARFRPGPTEGKTEKDGCMHLSMSFRENVTEAFIKGEKAAVTDPDGVWQSVADLEDSEGPGRWLAMIVRNVRTPAVQAAEIVASAPELKKDGDVYAGDLTEDGVKALLTFRRRSGDDGPAISDPKGSVKVWIKDGLLTKFEYHVQGLMDWNGNEFDVERTTTVEIKDVGTTKVEVPEEAKQKLS